MVPKDCPPLPLIFEKFFNPTFLNNSPPLPTVVLLQLLLQQSLVYFSSSYLNYSDKESRRKINISSSSNLAIQIFLPQQKNADRLFSICIGKMVLCAGK